MAFVDELKIRLSAGRGGDGVVRWRQEKFVEKGGPSGGNGGQGGAVFVEAVRDLSILARYRMVKELRAGDGESGMKMSKTGRDGKDLVIELPIGSIITNQSTGTMVRLEEEGQKQCLLSGGDGGFGNEHFKSSTNVAPREWNPGAIGETAQFLIELELYADLGLIGLPNAGKSSLLNALTNATAKVGSYPFTTLEPNLGDLYGFILADIPGLIEGASAGKGLGHKFLRHVRRTKMFCHLISLENERPADAYRVIRVELEAFDRELIQKPELILLTKTDLVTPEVISAARLELETFGREVLTVSVNDEASVKIVRDRIVALLSQAGRQAAS